MRPLGPISLYSTTWRRWEFQSHCCLSSSKPLTQSVLAGVLSIYISSDTKTLPLTTFPSWCSCFPIFWRKFLQSPELLREHKGLEDRATPWVLPNLIPSSTSCGICSKLLNLFPLPKRRTEGICIHRGRWGNGLMGSGAMAPESVIWARIMCSAGLQNYYKPQGVLRDGEVPWSTNEVLSSKRLRFCRYTLRSEVVGLFFPRTASSEEKLFIYNKEIKIEISY